VSVHVHTARLGTRCADGLNITRMTGVDAFAPSWAILRPALALLKSGRMDANGWADYEVRYTAEMRESYRDNRAPWDALLACESVTLLCYCAITPARPWCHRRTLAGILAKLGAVDCGEVLA
jgi:uncharacterized protein YeaO (DUF488 family)